MQALTSLINIIKVNEVKRGTAKATGNPYEIQDCECILLNDDGSPAQVGVLMLPKSMIGTAAPKLGTYIGQFSLQPDLMTRRIEARLVGLSAVPAKQISKA